MRELADITAFSEIYTQFWLRNLQHMQRGWSVLIVAAGIALIVAGEMRLAWGA